MWDVLYLERCHHALVRVALHQKKLKNKSVICLIRGCVALWSLSLAPTSSLKHGMLHRVFARGLMTFRGWALVCCFRQTLSCCALVRDISSCDYDVPRSTFAVLVSRKPETASLLCSNTSNNINLHKTAPFGRRAVRCVWATVWSGPFNPANVHTTTDNNKLLDGGGVWDDSSWLWRYGWMEAEEGDGGEARDSHGWQGHAGNGGIERESGEAKLKREKC